MIDLQNEPDLRGIELSCAGISDFKHPIKLDIDGQAQHTIATFSCSTQLESAKRGAHMSRFIEMISGVNQNEESVFSINTMKSWHQELLKTQEASQGKLNLKCSFFLNKTAPKSQKSSLMNYDLELQSSGDFNNPTVKVIIHIPCTSCCPCSKAISQYGAHNQRTVITLSFNVVDLNQTPSLIEIIRSVEKSASSELFALIKREDEKFVTEKAYEGAKFAEDIARDTAQNLSIFLDKISKVHIHVENFESIHNHSAFAQCMIKD